VFCTLKDVIKAELRLFLVFREFNQLSGSSQNKNDLLVLTIVVTYGQTHLCLILYKSVMENATL